MKIISISEDSQTSRASGRCGNSADKIVSDFLKHADSLIGTPWVHQGRTPTGVDCAGLIYLCLQHVGIEYATALDYAPNNYFKYLRDGFGPPFYETRDITPGDVIQCYVNGAPTHLLIYDGPTVIHASITKRRVVRTASKYWINKLYKRWRWAR